MKGKHTVGFIGLGNMGGPMAANVLRAGFPLVLWNRTRERAQGLLDQGATWGSSPREVAEKCDILVTVLTDAQAVRDVLLGEEGVIHAEGNRPIVVEMSTIAPADSTAVAEELRMHGIVMLDAPISGSTKAAEDATVTLLVGGDTEALERVRPVLEAMAKNIYHMGPNGQGCHMKLVNNVILAAVLAGFSEAFVMGRKAGLDGRRMLDVVLHGSAACPLLEFKGRAIVERNFSPTFHLRMMRKDLGLAMATAEGLNAPMPLTSLLKELHQAGMAQGLGDEDFSSIVKVFEGLSSLG
jgi:3-hydroxyisobutyrate dehydrogenase-like beta-hydroxyacid dehydrogenase